MSRNEAKFSISDQYTHGSSVYGLINVDERRYDKMLLVRSKECIYITEIKIPVPKQSQPFRVGRSQLDCWMDRKIKNVKRGGEDKIRR